MDDKQSRALALAAARDDVLLAREARAMGLSPWDFAQLRRGGGLAVVRGAIAIPTVRDPVRTAARALQVQLPQAVISHLTADRLHGLEGLGWWEPEQGVDATVPAGATRAQRRGARLRFTDLAPADIVDLDGLAVTSVARTLIGSAGLVSRDRFVSLVDSALYQGLLPADQLAYVRDRLTHRHRGRYVPWVDLADGRSESPSETVVRLLLVDANLAPDELQYDVWAADGSHVGRLDAAWTSNGRKVGLEVDSAWHDLPRAVYRDRDKLNGLRARGWDVRQVTAYDAYRRPAYVRQQVRQALDLQS